MRRLIAFIIIMLIATTIHAEPRYFSGIAFINDAEDSAISGETTNDTLQWNGSAWENRQDITVNSISVGAGLEAAPSIMFEDIDGGIYTSATNTIGIVLTGMERFTLGPNYLSGDDAGAYEIRHAGASASLPTYTFKTDRDTGMWWLGANNIQFVTGAVEVYSMTNTTGNAKDTRITVEGGIGPYGQIWWHDNDGVGIGTDVTIATTSVFVNVASANITTDISSNTTLSAANGSITVLKGGKYNIASSQSFTTSTAAIVDHAIGVNGVVNNACRNQRSITTGGSTDTAAAPLNCQLVLADNDVVTLMANSVASESVMYEALNLNVTK